MNIIQAINDPQVFAPHFRGSTWSNWLVFLAALFGLPLTPEQSAIYTRFTGRTTPPTSPLQEAWLVVGRRGGKSFILAVIATFLACFKDWRPLLGPGEVGTIMIIARDRRQARVIKRFITGLLRSVPMLAQTIESETQEIIELRNSVNIEIHTASFRSTRGYTIITALLDEVAYWDVDENSAEPDVEVINAIRPGMATVPGAMLLVASSPHARKGALWNAHQKHFGKDGDPVLVWQAATRDMNAAVPQSFIDTHIQEDPARARAEYGAIFRTDLEAFVSREAVEACIIHGVHEHQPQYDITYSGFVDPSGGSGSDSMTLCIGHRDSRKGVVVIDCVRERKPPFSPEQVCSEFAAALKRYRIHKVSGDKFGGGFPPEQFRQFDIIFEQSAKTKSDLYVDLLPLVNSQRIELLDQPRLIAQLNSLERRTARGGKDSIDHPPGGHDDLINSVAGLASTLLAKSDNQRFWEVMSGITDDDPYGIEGWRMLRFAEHIRRFG